MIKKKTDQGRQGGVNCLIIDDSDIEKRGKKIEKVSGVWNHVFQRPIFGFKLLMRGYYHGRSFIPVDFSLHLEKGTNEKTLFSLKKI